MATAIVVASLGCGGDPDRQPVTGHWVGTLHLYDESWIIDMTLTQTGSDLSGSATRSTYANVPYLVTGELVGDSVFLHFMPPEDIDLRFGLRSGNRHLVGVMWFGTHRDGAIPITFDRQ